MRAHVSIISMYLVSHPLWFYPVLVFRALPMALYWSSAAAFASDMAPLEKRGEAMHACMGRMAEKGWIFHEKITREVRP